MRFTLQLPTDRVRQGEEFVSAEAIAEMARATERAGFDAAFVTDHPAPEDRWLRSGGHQALDQGVGLDREVGAVRDGVQEPLGGVPAHAGPLVHMEVAAAFVVAPVEIVDLGDAGLARGIAERVDTLAARTLPTLQRSVKWGMSYYGVGDGWCFCCGGFADHVKLMFVNGAALKPVPPVTPVAMGKSTRGVELKSVHDLDERQIAAWMSQVVAVPGVGGKKR